MIDKRPWRWTIVIPARAGSQRFPRKHHEKIGNSSLIERTIQQATRLAIKLSNSPQIVCTSDDSQILETAERHGLHIIQRPFYLSDSLATSEQVMNHVTEVMPVNHNILWLQPTSPFRRDSQVMKVMDLLKKADSSAMYTAHDKPPSWYRLADVTDTNELIFRTKTEEAQCAFLPTGGAYCFSLDSFKNSMSFVTGLHMGINVPAIDAIDIDTPRDLEIARKLYYIWRKELTDSES